MRGAGRALGSGAARAPVGSLPGWPLGTASSTGPRSPALAFLRQRHPQLPGLAHVHPVGQVQRREPGPGAGTGGAGGGPLRHGGRQEAHPGEATCPLPGPGIPRAVGSAGAACRGREARHGFLAPSRPVDAEGASSGARVAGRNPLPRPLSLPPPAGVHRRQPAPGLHPGKDPLLLWPPRRGQDQHCPLHRPRPEPRVLPLQRRGHD